MDSLWISTVKKPSFQRQKEDEKTDVLIIGGGLSGLLTAYMLEEEGIDYILVEKGKICGGVTSNTTAKITCQHGLIYQKLLRGVGATLGKMYLDANHAALLRYRELSENIDCDFRERDSYVYSLTDRQKIEDEIRALETLGFPCDFTKSTALPFSVAGAAVFRKQAEFNPLKFAYGIAEGLNIREDTEVVDLLPDGAITNGGKISAEKIIVATHFPFLNKHGFYFLKMHQHRSYVIAFKNAGDVDGMYVDESLGGLSFRNYGDLLLLGGGSHRTGERGGSWREISEVASRYYPRATEVFRWATQDCMTLDDVPYIGQYSKNTPNLYVATGFNKWGMTSSMVAAQILTDMISGKENPYSQVFSPSRSILHPKLAVNLAKSLKNILTPTAPRCTHLGCALKYNPQEHSWDCPCHGSRYTDDGKVLNNPATKNLKL